MRKKEKKEKKLNREELIGFCSQMAAILHSGISSFEGISLMMEERRTLREERLWRRFIRK